MPNQESLFSITFEEAGIGMLLVDQSGNVLKSNRVLQDWLGYSDDELQTMTFGQREHYQIDNCCGVRMAVPSG